MGKGKGNSTEKQATQGSTSQMPRRSTHGREGERANAEHALTVIAHIYRYMLLPMSTRRAVDCSTTRSCTSTRSYKVPSVDTLKHAVVLASCHRKQPSWCSWSLLHRHQTCLTRPRFKHVDYGRHQRLITPKVGSTISSQAGVLLIPR